MNSFVMEDGKCLLKACFDFIDAVVDSVEPGSIFHEPGLSLMKDVMNFKHSELNFVKDGMTGETRFYTKCGGS